MEPLFKNVTKYTANNYKEFAEFHSNKYSFSHNIYTLIMSILLLYCVILNIKNKDILLILFFLLLLILFLVWRLYIPNKRYQKMKENYKNNKVSEFEFSFYKNYFTINKKTLYYFKLFKIFETNDYFYLYVDEDNAALVSKTGFKVGSADEFSKFIKKKCLLKYSRQD